MRIDAGRHRAETRPQAIPEHLDIFENHYSERTQNDPAQRPALTTDLELLNAVFDPITQMKRRPSTKKLPKALKEAKDTRELFSYFLRKAALGPEPAMVPKKGAVRRVLPFTESFNDRFVCTLAQVANLKELTSGLEELRFVATKITGAGVAQLTSLLPDVKITAVSADEWIRNPETNNPAFNLETGHLDAAVEENEIDDSYDVEAELMKRFGQLPPGFTSKKAK